MKTLKERFDEKWIPVPESGCWLWTAAVDSKGYGQIRRGTAQEGLVLAHRLSYELYVGSILNEQHVCHRCDIPACVNPEHLFLGTQSDNMADCAKKKRIRIPQMRGIANNNSKLTEAQVYHIKNFKKDYGYIDYEYLAAKFGVSHFTIRDIVSGRTWTHVV